MLGKYIVAVYTAGAIVGAHRQRAAGSIHYDLKRNRNTQCSYTLITTWSQM